MCFKEIENEPTIHSLIKSDIAVCHDCFLEMKPVFNTFECDGIKCLSIFNYNEKIREILYQFKGCKDYELKNVFFDYFSDYLNIKFRNYVIIPAPSFSKADEERGFNHVEEMFSFLKAEMIKCVHKTKNIKQADMSSEKRKKVKDFLIMDDVNLKNKNVLIVDDVFTTGSTIKAIVGLVKKREPKRIKVLVMSKTIDLNAR